MGWTVPIFVKPVGAQDKAGYTDRIQSGIRKQNHMGKAIRLTLLGPWSGANRIQVLDREEGPDMLWAGPSTNSRGEFPKRLGGRVQRYRREPMGTSPTKNPPPTSRLRRGRLWSSETQGGGTAVLHKFCVWAMVSRGRISREGPRLDLIEADDESRDPRSKTLVTTNKERGEPLRVRT